jgi:hypothetical protein
MSWHIIGEAISLVTWWGLRDRVLRRSGPATGRSISSSTGAPAAESLAVATADATVAPAPVSAGVPDVDVESASNST